MKKLTTLFVVAIIQTNMGDIEVKLYDKRAPKTVENFIGLATGKKEWKDPKTGKMVKNKSLYEGTIFHRIIPEFMIQGGDPLGNGTGGPGYNFNDEITPEDDFMAKPGLLAMANAGTRDGKGTNGSQFFITTHTEHTRHLKGLHTIFGEVTKGYDVVEKISAVKTGYGDKPEKDVVIKKIVIKDEDDKKKEEKKEPAKKKS